jgi:hypothetical protein
MDNFHDAIVRRVVFEGPDYVNEGGEVVYGEEGIVSVVIQSQDDQIRSAHFEFSDVHNINVDTEREICPANVCLTASGRWIAEFLCCRVEASSCKVWITGDDLAGEVPPFC